MNADKTLMVGGCDGDRAHRIKPKPGLLLSAFIGVHRRLIFFCRIPALAGMTN